VAYDVSQHEVASSGDLIAVSPADGDGPGSVRIERSSLERWLVAGAKSSAASGCAFVDVVQLSVGKTPRSRGIGDAQDVLELLWLLLTAGVAWAYPRQDLVLENLLLRHQLAVLTRPTRARPHARLRLWDKLIWILARRSAPAGVSTWPS
jgi:hypothetical protein